MDRSEEKIIEAFAITAFFPIMIIALELLFLPFALLNGWVMTYAWRWFMVPAFHLPQLGVLQLAGVTLIVRKFSPKPNTETVKWGKAIVMGILEPLLFLVSAAILHWLLLRYS